jgi:hypothetical protein
MTDQPPTIRQNTAFLESLISEGQDGRLVPARFQRPYRWNSDAVIDLWQSLIIHCPIGSALVWYPNDRQTIDRFAGSRLGPIQTVPNERSGILLDGHNRLASFAWSLCEPTEIVCPDMSAEERDTWQSGRRLILDAADRAFRFVDRAGPLTEKQFAPGTILDPIGLNRALRNRPVDACSTAELDWLDQVGAYARNARITVTTLEGHSAREAFAIFRRIVRVGCPITEADFARAMEWESTLDADLGTDRVVPSAH